VEPRLKLDRGRGGLTFALLTQMMILAVTILAAYLAFAYGPIDWGSIAQAVILLAVGVILFAHLIPHVLITRTTGDWLAGFGWLLRLSALLALPVVAVLSFSFSVATLGSERDTHPEAASASENIETLIDRGEEHGLIEEDDRRLIQSVVEFGDKTVREIMTPRPNIVAVEKDATLEDLLRVIETKHYSRVPVYSGDLDNILGFVYAREIIQLGDQDLKRIRAGERTRPVLFVPETKPVAHLMREMQHQNIHMAIVIDEYGSVAGLATMEDLVEEIVGEIHDETETQRDVLPEGDNSYLVAGHVDIDRLGELFGSRPEVPGDAATVAGLVNTLAGHVPQVGEVLEHDGLRFEIVAADGLKVDRMRIRAIPPPEPPSS
jgi:putative hemolysin